MMTQLDLRFLGAPIVKCEGRKVTFPTRKTLALLVYLAAEPKHHPRETVAATFWPESTTRRARTSLRTTLTYLRTAVPGVVEADHHTLQFNAAVNYVLDLEKVENIYRRLQSNGQIKTDGVLTALQAYRGEFLAGFSAGAVPEFEDWAMLQREIWHQRIDVLFNYLTQAQFDNGEFLRALETTNRWMSHAPLHEAVYRRMMQLYWAMGDTASALRTYEACEAMLANELGLPPSAETEAIVEQIRQHRPVSLDKPETQQASPNIVPVRGPLVGRQSEFRMLIERYHHAKNGQPQVVALLGSAGIGKTRLAEEFIGWTSSQGADVLQGSSMEADTSLPYHPIVDALRPRLERENAPEDFLSDVWLTELSRLLPELRERYPDLPIPYAGDLAAQSRLFETVVRLTIALTERKPLIFFIDDLQWADRTSLELLHYLAKCWQERNAPVFLLLTLRGEALHPLTVARRSGLTNWLNRMQYTVRFTTVHLRELDEDATISYVQSYTDAPATAFGRWLHQETEGLPLFMVEILKELYDRGVLQARHTPEGQWRFQFDRLPQVGDRYEVLPKRIRTLILQRLQRLSETAFALLAAGAVLGNHLTFNNLCAVAALEETAALHGLDELLKNQLLRETRVPSGFYQFTHTKIQDVIYTEAGEARRRIFHRRAFHELSALAPAAEVARHAFNAGLVEEGIRYEVRAGDEAMALFATREAIEHYEMARKHLGQTAATFDSNQICYLFNQLGSAYELAGKDQAALAAYHALEALGRDREEQTLILAALVARAALRAAPVPSKDPAKAEMLVEKAMNLAKELNDRHAEARLHQVLMKLYRFSERLQQACEAGERSLEIARQLNFRSQMGRTLNDLITVYEQAGKNVQRLAALEESVALWRELNNPVMLAESLAAAVARNIITGDFDVAIATADEAMKVSETIDYKRGRAFSLMWIGRLYWEQGDPGRAIETMERCLDLAAASGFMPPLTMTRGELAYVYGQIGAIEKAFSILESLREFASGHLPAYLPTAYWYTATLHLLTGNVEEAKQWRDAIQIKGTPIYPLILPRLANLNAQLAIVDGDYQAAQEHSERALMMLQVGNARTLFPTTLSLQAQAYIGLGQSDAASATLAEARQLAESIGLRPILCPILGLLARIERAQGASEKAQELVEEAQHIIDEMVERTPPALSLPFQNHALNKLKQYVGG